MKVGMETGGPEDLIGRELGGYQLTRIIGDGAIGVVYEGARLDPASGLPERAAIKVLSVPWQLRGPEREEFRARFLREGEALQRLQHPNIVRLYALGETPRPYLALEYVAGGTLEGRRRAEQAEGRPFSLISATPILQQLASALDTAHAQGIVHRDVKPTNVLLDERGNVRLSDFSVAHLLNEATAHLTRTGNQIGTRGYMAPEQARGERDVGPAADIYSLGALMYYLLTGQTPSDQPGQRTRSPRALRPDLPDAAASAIMKALAERPSDRFGSAGAFARAYAAGLQGQYVEGNAPNILASAPTQYGGEVPTTIGANAPQPYASAAPRSRVNPWFAILAALTLVAVFAVVLGGLRLPTGGSTGPGGTGTNIASGPPTATPYPPTSTTAPGGPTPTPYPPTDTPYPTVSSMIPTFTPTNTPTDTPTPTATPTLVPTPTNTPCPFVDNHGQFPTFYASPNWQGQSVTFQLNPGQDLFFVFPGWLQQNLESFTDPFGAFHIVTLHTTNFGGNFAHWDTAQPGPLQDVDGYKRSASVEIYFHRTC
jgi:serine/threonine-protein kinase